MYKTSFFRFRLSNSTKNCVDISCSGMENPLESCWRTVADLSRFWDWFWETEIVYYESQDMVLCIISFADYQKLSFNDRFPILRNYYLEMSKKCPVGSGIFLFLLLFCLLLLLFGNNFLIFKFYCFLGDHNFSLVPQNSFENSESCSDDKILDWKWPKFFH